MNLSDEESESLIRSENIFVLTSVPNSNSLDEYLTDERITSSWENMTYYLILGSSKRDANLKVMIDKYKDIIVPFVPILFKDVHNYLYAKEMFKKTMRECENWKIVYNKIYATTKSRYNFDYFMEVLPYLYSFSILRIYSSINSDITERIRIVEKEKSNGQTSINNSNGYYEELLPIPTRSEVCSRVVYLFSSMTLLHSFLEDRMNLLFGADDIKRPVTVPPKEEHESLKYEVEDLKNLVTLERRPRSKVSQWNPLTKSPILISGRPDLSRSINLIYPPSRDEFANVPRFTDSSSYSGPYDPSETNSLLLRSRCSKVDAPLRSLQAEGTLKKISLMHQCELDIRVIKDKFRAVYKSSERDRDIFVHQLKTNQENGIYAADPEITMELVRDDKLARKTKDIRICADNINQIVDDVLFSASERLKDKERKIIHLSDKARYSMFDPRDLIRE